MAFWSGAELEPLRQFRWIITFGGSESLDNVSYALKKVSRPKSKIGEITHKYLNHSFYYPGRLEWEAVNMTFASVPTNTSDAASGTAQKLLTILASAGYVIPNNPNGEALKTLSKSNFKYSLGELTIKNIDPDGNVVESFQLHNPFFTSVEFGEMDYGSDEIIDITCTVRYDYATFMDSGGTNTIAGTPSLTKG